MKFDICAFFENVKKIQFSLKSGRIKGTLQEDKQTFLVPRSVLLRIRNVSDKGCSENQNTFCFQ